MRQPPVREAVGVRPTNGVRLCAAVDLHTGPAAKSARTDGAPNLVPGRYDTPTLALLAFAARVVCDTEHIRSFAHDAHDHDKRRR